MKQSNESRAGERSAALAFARLVTRYFVVGPKVEDAVEQLIRAYKQETLAVHDKEIAAVVGAIVRRMSLVLLMGFLVGAIPAVTLIYQSNLLRKQTSLLVERDSRESLQILRRENTAIAVSGPEGSGEPDAKLNKVEIMIFNNSNVPVSLAKVWLIYDIRFKQLVEIESNLKSDLRTFVLDRKPIRKDRYSEYAARLIFGSKEIDLNGQLVGKGESHTFTFLVQLPYLLERNEGDVGHVNGLQIRFESSTGEPVASTKVQAVMFSHKGANDTREFLVPVNYTQELGN